MTTTKGGKLSGGELSVDPSENVKALSEAANKRQDDLRQASEDKMQVQIQHVEEVSRIRADFAKEIRHLESDRLNAIRQVDVTAVKTEADRALQAIQALAATTATNAETLRNALTNTATTIAKQTSDTVGQLIERIAALEKSSYEGVGRQRLADPQMIEMLAELKRLGDLNSSSSGRGSGMTALWGWIVGAVAILISIGSFLFNVLK